MQALRYASVIVGALLVAPACGASRPAPPPPPALQAARPVAAIPADLDLVMRIDLERIRAVLGNEITAALRSRAVAGAGADSLLAEAMARAETAWIGIRPNLAPELTDNVIVLRGRFAGLDPSLPTWRPATDLGGAWRRYERAAAGDRASPARVYASGEELLVFASKAELDSVERAVERGQNEGALEPPERGVLSIAARSAPLADALADRSPSAASLLRKSRKLEASAELGETELRAELALSFELQEDARAAADASGLLVKALRASSGPLSRFADGISVEAVQTTLVVRIRAPLDVIRAFSA
jgi:hypothetical protein